MQTILVSNGKLSPVKFRLRRILQEKVDSQGPVETNAEDLETRIADLETELVVVQLSPEPESVFEALRVARRYLPGRVLAVGPAADPKLILRALNEGADHYLDEDDLDNDLNSALARFHIQEPSRSQSTGKLIAVLSASGGCGGSTLAVNCATTLCEESDGCALLDMKPGRGDLAALLDLRPAYTFADICLNADRFDQSMLEKVLVAHESGVKLVAAPQIYADTRSISLQGINQTVQLTRSMFSHTVVDLEDCFHEEQAFVINQADWIFVVCRLDFTCLRNVRRIIEHCTDSGISSKRLFLIANRVGQHGELDSHQAESALNAKLSFQIPDDPKSVISANNVGVPVTLEYPKAKASEALRELTYSLILGKKSKSKQSGILTFAGR